MKHSYTVGCACKRCAKELVRRQVQGMAQPPKRRSLSKAERAIDRREQRLVELNNLDRDEPVSWAGRRGRLVPIQVAPRTSSTCNRGSGRLDRLASGARDPQPASRSLSTRSWRVLIC